RTPAAARWPTAAPSAAMLSGAPCSAAFQEAFELVEGFAPAALVVVSHRLIEELLVQEHELGAARRRAEADGDERLALRRAVGPGPGEHQLAVGHDLAIDACTLVRLAVGAAEH